MIIWYIKYIANIFDQQTFNDDLYIMNIIKWIDDLDAKKNFKRYF